MNQIRAIQALNKREIEQGVPPEASWHTDYRDTAFVNFGGMPYELSEGDVITIFSQYGEPVFIKLVRDPDTGKSKGFGWLKYEDQRSTDLAVDNLGGATISGRMIRVDHARYKPRDDDDPEEGKCGWEDLFRLGPEEKREAGEADTDVGDETEEDDARNRPLLPEESELQHLITNHDDDDPMKAFLIEEKKKEVEEALRRERKKDEKHKQRSRYHRGHRSRREHRDYDERRDKRHRGSGEHGHRSSQRDRTPERLRIKYKYEDSGRYRRRRDDRSRDRGHYGSDDVRARDLRGRDDRAGGRDGAGELPGHDCDRRGRDREDNRQDPGASEARDLHRHRDRDEQARDGYRSKSPH